MENDTKRHLTLFVIFAFGLVMVLLYIGGHLSLDVHPFGRLSLLPHGYPSESFSHQKPQSRQKQPHIVMIVTDDQGYNDIGYHNPSIKTPTLDRLARTGVILENYYVQPVCTPTRSQLLSGKYQIHTGLQHGIATAFSCKGIPEEMPLISDKLQQAGYKTHAVGKWHVGFCKEALMPTNRGFDTFFGSLTGYQDHYTRMHWDKFGGRDLRDNLAPVKQDNGTYSTIMLADKAAEIIEKHDQSQPMFLYLAFSAVHAPLQVPDHYRNPYRHIPDGKRQIFAGMVTCVDEAVANVTRALKKKGMWNNTVLVFTTDNGADSRKGGSNRPLRGDKGQHWEGGIRAVGFVHSALLRQEVVGTVSRQLIHVTDWFPTFLKLAGQEENAGDSLDGFSQWSIINGIGRNRRKEILINIVAARPYGNQSSQDPFDTSIWAGIRAGDWKLLTGQKPNTVHLFNITADPRETTDVSSSHPDIVKMLLEKLKTYQQGSVPLQEETVDPRSNPSRHGGFWGPWL